MRAWPIVLALAACQPRTEILLGIATDMKSPTALNQVRLEVGRSGTGVPQQIVTWDVPGVPNMEFTLPGSYGIVSEDGLIVDVTLYGLQGGNEVVKRDAKLTLVEGETLFYRMGLTQSCADTNMVCMDGQTCIEGRCEGRELDPDLLPQYIPELVTTQTCESLTTYINSANGQPMPYSEDFAECPYILCYEATCMDIPPGAHLYRGVCNAVSSFALLVDGDKAGASLGFFRGLDGTATANEFHVNIDINGEATDFTGTFQGDRAYALGISDSGSIRCDAYEATPKRYCGTFTRTSQFMNQPQQPPIMGRVAFVRGGDVLFGQYANEPQLVGSFDGWPIATTSTGESFNMIWRNEAFMDISIESGIASATLDGDKLTGTWSGTADNGATTIRGSFEADPTRCRATTLPNCGGACVGGQTCIKGTCVGTGQLRFTLEWDVATDIDLHVLTPSGAEISWMKRNGDSGTLDVDDQGAGHLIENVYFTAPATGMYQVWATNYDGDTAVNYTITVAGTTQPVSTFTGMLAADHVESARYMYTR